MNRREDGSVSVFTAVVSLVLMMMAAFAVDIGHTWATRGQLQVQADRAATYAARYLPADSDEERTRVARAVAYYVACHPVPGQKKLEADIPACPENPESSSLDTYAARLLADGRVSFPARNQVRVVTPKARVEFGFGRAAGVDGTVQHKVATAKVTSPGMLSPMGLSLDCLLNTGANLLGGAGLPFGYVSTTHHTASGPTTTWSGTTQDAPTRLGINPASVPQQLTGTGPLVRVSGRGWPVLSAGQSFTVVFARGSGLTRQQHSVTGSLVLAPEPNRRRAGYVEVALPAPVVVSAGTWQVKVAVTAGLSTTYSVEFTTLDVVAAATLPDGVSCGRLVKSPRGNTQADVNMVLNLQEGIDHLLETYPYVLGNGGLTRESLLNVAAVTQCASSNQATVRDVVYPTGTPDCLVTNMSANYEAGFTEGMIGAAGRLTCTDAHPCRPGRSFTLNGRSINDDYFTDFVEDTSLLTSDTFFNLDTFLTTGLPVVTPTSNLHRDIYNSGRFMWVAVISTVGAVSEVQSGDYPVLTFRPIFVTQDSALDQLPLVEGASAGTVDVVDQAMRSALVQPHRDEHGLIMDGDRLAALRFMTISPDALPAVPADYAGPESEYLGVGPKIIRLVE